MEFLIVIGGVFVLGILFVFGYTHFDQQKKGYDFSCVFHHIDGLSGFGEGIEVVVEFYKDRITVADYGGRVLIIPHNQIKDIEFESMRVLAEKQKSLIARGVVGGAIFGLPGMLLGGLSGLGTKENEESIPVFLFKYTSRHKKDAIALFKLKHDFESDKLTKIIELFNKHKESIINKDI